MTWHGINDTEDAIYALIIAGGLLTLLIQAIYAIKDVCRRPEPIPEGTYSVVVCNAETPRDGGELIHFQLTGSKEDVCK